MRSTRWSRLRKARCTALPTASHGCRCRASAKTRARHRQARQLDPLRRAEVGCQRYPFRDRARGAGHQVPARRRAVEGGAAARCRIRRPGAVAYQGYVRARHRRAPNSAGRSLPALVPGPGRRFPCLRDAQHSQRGRRLARAGQAVAGRPGARAAARPARPRRCGGTRDPRAGGATPACSTNCWASPIRRRCTGTRRAARRGKALRGTRSCASRGPTRRTPGPRTRVRNWTCSC